MTFSILACNITLYLTAMFLFCKFMLVTLLFTILFINTENKIGKAKTRKVEAKENRPKQKSSTGRKEDQPSGKYCFYLPSPVMSTLIICYYRHLKKKVSCLHTATKDR